MSDEWMMLYDEGEPEPIGSVRLGPIEEGRVKDVPADALVDDSEGPSPYMWVHRRDYGLDDLEPTDKVCFRAILEWADPDAEGDLQSEMGVRRGG